ncbi:MAG: hypothetical protein Q4D38_15130, partial [Planctomycetia bacterium]|nr:hypothetical protein [Planctomycetia bacterium]
MYRKAILYVFVIAAVFVTSLGNSALGQGVDNLILHRTYGLGIHEYNQHDYEAAFNTFTKCVDGKTQNPCVYYYRGLCLIQLGRPEAAEVDFQKGADLEMSASSNMQTQIGYDLQKVQGGVRLLLEKHRAEAKLNAYQKRQEIVAKRQKAPTVEPGYSDAQVTGEGHVYTGDDIGVGWGDDGLDDPLAEGSDDGLGDPLDGASDEDIDEGLDECFDD